MAVIPGTKYAEGTLPGRTGQVPKSAPRDNGQQITSELDEAARRLMVYALDVQNKKMVAEASQKQREIDEAGWAASEAVTGNDEADKKIWDKFNQDTQKIANSSEYKDVNSLLQEHLNSVSPNWEHAFRVKSLGIQGKNAVDEILFSGERLLSYGDMEGYKKRLDKAFELNGITPAEYNKLIENAPAEMHIKIADRLLDEANQSEGKKDYQAVLDELDKTKDLDLDDKQREKRQALRLTAEKAKGELDKATINKHLDNVIGGKKSLKDVLDDVKAEENLDGIQKTELAKLVLNTAKTFQDEGTNFLNETRDPEKLVETYNKIKRKELTTYDQLFQVFSEGETPPFSFGYLQNLENLRMSVTGSGKADLTEMKFRTRLMDEFSKNGKLIPSKRGQYQKADAKLTELYKQYGNDPTKMETEFQKLLGEEKQVEAKKFLSSITKGGILESQSQMIGIPYGFSSMPISSDVKKQKGNKSIIENPFKDEYPDAYYENGNWYVMRDGKRYRVE